MRILFAITTVLFSINASAIEFFTEEEVKESLKADNVIEISKYAALKRGLIDNPDCKGNAMSKSARAYLVAKDRKVFVYLTPSSINDLRNCGEL
jgi:hypothetical protein